MFKSLNPHSNQVIATHQQHTSAQIETILTQAENAFTSYQATSLNERAAWLLKLADALAENELDLALMAMQEMGKPIAQARAEVQKCAWVCQYYAEHGASMLSPREQLIDQHAAYSTYEPLGTILAIMPWNYPYWQVFRYLAPAIMLGNTSVLKHAPTTLGCAKHIEELCTTVGLPTHTFQLLICDTDAIPAVIEDNRIHGVTLTGSTSAGRAVAQLAGKALKPVVLELGGSNPLLVLEDADLQQAIDVAWSGRMQNTGQSCIALKRFLVHASLVDDFTHGFLAKFDHYPVGDPADEATYFGPLARPDLARQIHTQCQQSITKGAKLLRGGNISGARFEPSLLSGVTPEMEAFNEETFGPLACITSFKENTEALRLANTTSFGLGASVVTQHPEEHLSWTKKIQGGALFFNELVKSDPRLPFGGTHASGYGRELSREGLYAFANIKPVFMGV